VVVSVRRPPRPARGAARPRGPPLPRARAGRPSPRWRALRRTPDVHEWGGDGSGGARRLTLALSPGPRPRLSPGSRPL